ncbi:hypothetical protein [Spirosoma areae]
MPFDKISFLGFGHKLTIEVTDVALWLCSDESTFMAGLTLPVDGGAFA